MAIVEENQKIPAIQEPNPCPNKPEAHIVSQTSSCNPKDEPSPPPQKVPSPKENILAVAAGIAAQPLPCSDPDVWGVLTAISNNARKRSQGINILLTADEHYVGRVVDDVRFQIDSSAVSQRHCEIFRKEVPKEDLESPSGFCNGTFIKDTSTNGTFINWKKLKRGSARFEARVRHGDIVSFAAPPQHEQAFAFVYREVLSSVPLSDGNTLKRKAEEFSSENKRPKGIGIGAPEGPISLDDFRSLQRSNTELRKQLESHVLTIDTLRNENREALERHENEMKELRESISKSYQDQLNDLIESLEITKKELTEVNKTSAEQKYTIEDLNERLSAALQSCTEANEIMKSQKASVAELKTQLDEERYQRREEREKAAADLKVSILRAQSEAQEELKRVSDAALRREREQQEVINKLQESERERSSMLENLRSKLEETREKLVLSDNRVRQLEAQVAEEQQAVSFSKKRVEELEVETRRMRRELDKEKAAREEAWAKVSALELDINAAMRDLDFERRRLKAARERIMLRSAGHLLRFCLGFCVVLLHLRRLLLIVRRPPALLHLCQLQQVVTSNPGLGTIALVVGDFQDPVLKKLVFISFSIPSFTPEFSKASPTVCLRGCAASALETQLRAFYSTTEEIKELFAKQQEQLKAMQRTLEDEENYDNASLDVFLNATAGNLDADAHGRVEAAGYRSSAAGKAGPSTSAPRFDGDDVAETSSNEASATEKHDCDIRSQDDENTQEAEYPNDDGLVKGGFGSDIDGVGTAPVFEGDADGTEQVLETESIDGEKNIDLNKPGNVAGDTMQLEDDTNVQETEQQASIRCEDSHQLSDREEPMKVAEDTEPGAIRTQDLLASEVAGSWACSTAPSVYGENESPHRYNESADNNEGGVHPIMHDSNTQVAESQSTPSPHRNNESLDLNERAQAIMHDSNTQVAVSQSTPLGGLATRRHPDHERQALSDMIGIMAPDVKEQFGSAVGNTSHEKNTKVSDSDSETDGECIEASKDVVDVDGGSGSDDETQANDPADDKNDEMEVVDDDDDAIQEDSVG
ncbi:hypothetical protein Cgig2_013138 [Carnegiea gigantea]|uniref:FHA domain-containing protein n=1 Tax=Carnegiea gigantea TaxID=171969 RepID=A0A9Q1QMV7_9CARY|nr:hypothetical protein Cgig2_013138 [Carnegiea gigantea]